MTRVVCISDTHNRLDKVNVPDGDVLVHAGDATMMGRREGVRAAVATLKARIRRHLDGWSTAITLKNLYDEIGVVEEMATDPDVLF